MIKIRRPLTETCTSAGNHKSHMNCLGNEPGDQRWGTASINVRPFMALIVVLCPKIFWKNLQRNCKTTLEAIQKIVIPRVN